ncbi:MAG: hypothetical protein PHC52_11320, partial [Syntrophales bacterium]|nr:hypothetical protein [Syntrophales bacterium]
MPVTGEIAGYHIPGRHPDQVMLFMCFTNSSCLIPRLMSVNVHGIKFRLQAFQPGINGFMSSLRYRAG